MTEIKTNHSLRRDDIVEPELSYRIVGSLYRVSNELGPGLHEKYYQRGIAVAFASIGVHFQEQVAIPLSFEGKVIGRYFADFVIEQKIVLEIKKGVRVNRRHAQQLLSYLKATGLPLGILAYFHSDGVLYKRILHSPFSDS